MIKKIRLIYFWPVIEFIVCTLVFLYQGGFGGGHGLDFYFMIFGFPGIYILIPFQYPPIADYIFVFNDYIHIVIYPIILNLIIISLLVRFNKD